MFRRLESRLRPADRPIALGRFASLAIAAFLGLLATPEARAGAIVVGRSGPANGCTVPSIQAAINRANGFGGHNLILVTDDVADGVYHENLNLANLRSGLQLEIVGGFNNCSELQPTASGKASIYGGGTSAPVMNIDGRVELRMRGFWMEGGTYGIAWLGTGFVELKDVTVNNNRWSGIDITGRGGQARLELAGGVRVSNNAADGILVSPRFGESSSYSSVLRIHGSGNAIVGNEDGIEVLPGGRLDLGGSGTEISGNRQYGILFNIWRGPNSRSSYVYSTDAANPLKISGNTWGGILFDVPAPSHQLCLRNILVKDNPGHAIFARGPHGTLEMNGSTCAFPPEADIVCDAVHYYSCNTFDNNGLQNVPLVRALNGAHVEINRALFYRNKGSSLLSTNLGADSSSATSVTLTNSVVLENALRDNLFEALNGGIVDVWDTTILGNVGGFSLSLVGIQPALLRLTNTILDQPQSLLSNVGPVSSIQLNRVLARNDTGAQSIPRTVLIGRPTYRDGIGRLSPFSLGVDVAPAGGGVDRDGVPRDVDTSDIPNVFGPRDLGAFESQVASTDRILADGFDR